MAPSGKDARFHCTTVPAHLLAPEDKVKGIYAATGSAEVPMRRDMKPEARSQMADG
jgi:hypothetical protein